MAVWTEIFQDSSEIKSKNVLEVKGQDSVEITNSGTKSIESTSNMFVLSSGGMYTGNMSGNIPTWLDDAITTEVANGTAPISQSVDELDTYVKNMENGVNQNIVNLQNKDQSLNALITTNKTESDNSLAAISDTLVTKITAYDATAISQQVMSSEFNDPNSDITNSAWYINNVKTYADATSANATSLDALSSVVTDPATGVEATADIIKTGYTTIGLNNDGTFSATANQSEYISAIIGPQKVSIDASDNVTIDADGEYTATTSKLITGADGSISGWTNSNYNGRSDFTIQADTFKVQGEDSGYTPFAIDTDTGKIKFTGNVRFEGLGINGSSTTIDGGVIQTGKIKSLNGNTYFDLSNNRLVIGGGAITLDSRAAGTSAAPNISGGYIKGSTIEGSTLNSVTINTGTLNADLINSGSLTNLHSYSHNISAAYGSTVDDYTIPTISNLRGTGSLLIVTGIMDAATDTSYTAGPYYAHFYIKDDGTTICSFTITLGGDPSSASRIINFTHILPSTATHTLTVSADYSEGDKSYSINIVIVDFKK